MSSLLLFFAACAGLTGLVVDGYIFSVPREWLSSKHPVISYLLHCYQCSGFWCGILVGLMIDPLPEAAWRWLAYGIASSFIAPIAWAAFNYLNIVWDPKK